MKKYFFFLKKKQSVSFNIFLDMLNDLIENFIKSEATDSKVDRDLTLMYVKKAGWGPGKTRCEMKI